MIVMEVLENRPEDFKNLEKSFEKQGYKYIGIKWLNGETLFYQVEKIEKK